LGTAGHEQSTEVGRPPGSGGLHGWLRLTGSLGVGSVAEVRLLTNSRLAVREVGDGGGLVAA
jgi:hypothetical protein